MRVLPNKTYEKDLSVLLEGRSINDILIIDNNETKIKTHAQNVIPIMDYTGS
jgi:TFIIF-interacting CTD phosphatase-like protein